MGVRITGQEGRVALYDSVSGFAFGPTFEDEDEAQAFLEWWEANGDGRDLRALSDPELEDTAATYAARPQKATDE